MKYRQIKSDLKKAFQYDLRKWDKVKECFDCKKYRCVHLYLKNFNYSLSNICETSIRGQIPYSVSDIVERTYSQNQRLAYHEVQYQILCAELYFVVSTVERHDTIYGFPPNSERRKILQRCWDVTKDLFTSYHEGIDKFKDIPESQIIASTMMSTPFNIAVSNVYHFLRQRTDIDTRGLEHKVSDAVTEIMINVAAAALKIIVLIIAICLMAKCCGADVHPFG